MASSKKKWPGIPETVQAAGGGVEIEIASRAAMGNFMGTYHTDARRIRIAEDMKHEVAWLTLFHEQVEAFIHDAGLHNVIVTKKHKALKEAFCDAVALGMLAQFRHDNGL